MESIELIKSEVIRNLSGQQIIDKSIRDGEKPMGFLLSYLRDMYGISKIQSWPVAEEILAHYNINNNNFNF